LDAKNPLGKDFTDPDGLDDDFADALNRTVFVPKGRQVEISLSSKDVLHDFFLPNFRVKLDAVPGMRGLIFFKPTTSSAEIEAQKYVKEADGKKETLAIEGEILTADKVKAMREAGFKHFSIYSASKETVASEGPITTQSIDDLKKAGFTEVGAYIPQVWDLV